jgi:hypothetical protein
MPVDVTIAVGVTIVTSATLGVTVVVTGLATSFELELLLSCDGSVNSASMSCVTGASVALFVIMSMPQTIKYKCTSI